MCTRRLTTGLYPMRRLSFLVALACIAAQQTAGAFPFKSDTGFLPAKQVFKLDRWRAQGTELEAGSTVARGYYVYRRSLGATDAHGAPVPLTLPAGTAHHDQFFGDVEIYRDQALTIGLPATAPGPLLLHWQGCADAGVCYPPPTMRLDLPAGE